MSQKNSGPLAAPGLSRRRALRVIGAGTAGLAVAGTARAQDDLGPVAPPSTVTQPPRNFAPDAAPNVYFWDPDVIAVDPSFNGLAQPNAPIQRLWTGALWAEGPAWNNVGKYLIWSDIPNNRQLRYLSEDGHVSTFRAPSNNSNGNSFDYQGRQLSCEHLTRRVVRYELDGSTTILADNFEGKRFNSPNDVVAHPDGSYWFTDPPYGGQLYEGAPDAAGGPTNPDGLVNNRLGQPPEIGDAQREMETATYRLGPDGVVTRVASEADAPDPNGLAFSPDQSVLYVASTGKGPGDTGPGGQAEIIAFDVAEDGTLSNRRIFTDCMVDDVKCGPDGLAIDVYGNVWSSSNAGRNVGYSGVTCWSPEGALLGRIRLPEICGNLCFGGPKRNRLFMAASQSLYAVYTATQGVAPA
ncbi:SMP-30/gluconolactonase/LRE family protein [Actibacterium sp. 188UL27-1]|uniref:SMP-30/gluconolactonase/LRE family protein n=1 Tax=Actibacterium sp. 188UL27-1 TaxID=2786961 RepID=UPI001957321A|nr:SMP-30/gluconolactonase/LRE family protein [Actibacterium sp. 188UL27-1]MBM7066889.1 SMP-30/gluconolactonase/LRE family protein [Actibacterium sp. 188UL27-1]